MPNKFGTLFSKLEQKFEEAKISDLNHELGKWVQGTSTAFVDNFRGQSRPKFGQKPGGSGLPKSLSLPSFSAGKIHKLDKPCHTTTPVIQCCVTRHPHLYSSKTNEMKLV